MYRIADDVLDQVIYSLSRLKIIVFTDDTTYLSSLSNYWHSKLGDILFEKI